MRTGQEGCAPSGGSEILITFGSFKVHVISHITHTRGLSRNCIFFPSFLTPLGHLASNNQRCVESQKNARIPAGHCGTCTRIPGPRGHLLSLL